MANLDEHRRWNDPSWATIWLRRERVTEAVSEVLLGHVPVNPGDRVLDAACGGGWTTLEFSERVGPAGRVVGADFSEPLLAVARQRAREAGATNVEFVQVDLQVDDVPGAPFTVAASQFGVMFFDEPVTAFANVRRHVEEGGRFVFACWQAIDHNPWNLRSPLRPFVPPPTPPPPGKRLTGPFSLGDPVEAAGFLTAAGWSDVEVVPYQMGITVAKEAIFDESEVRSLVRDGVADEAVAAVEDHLAQFLNGRGTYDLPVAFQIVSSRA